MRGRVLPPAASPGTDPGAGAGYHPTALAAAVLCTGGPDVIRTEVWPSYRTISGVRLCWVSKNLKDLKDPFSPRGGPVLYRGTSLIRDSPPPRTTIGPSA